MAPLTSNHFRVNSTFKRSSSTSSAPFPAPAAAAPLPPGPGSFFFMLTGSHLRGELRKWLSSGSTHSRPFPRSLPLVHFFGLIFVGIDSPQCHPPKPCRHQQPVAAATTRVNAHSSRPLFSLLPSIVLLLYLSPHLDCFLSAT